jgi:hypothetical protein
MLIDIYALFRRHDLAHKFSGKLSFSDFARSLLPRDDKEHGMHSIAFVSLICQHHHRE